MYFFDPYLITTVDQSGDQEDTRDLRGREESGRESTPDSEETVHTEICKDQDDEEGKKLVRERERDESSTVRCLLLIQTYSSSIHDKTHHKVDNDFEDQDLDNSQRNISDHDG